MEIVKYLTAIGASCSTSAMDWSARNGYLDIVQWLHFNRSEGCSHNAMDDAALRGHLDIVKWLHFNRSEGCSYIAMKDAVRNGHIAIVKYLYENGLFTDRDSLRCAIEYAKNQRDTEIEIYLESVLAIE